MTVNNSLGPVFELIEVMALLIEIQICLQFYVTINKVYYNLITVVTKQNFICHKCLWGASGITVPFLASKLPVVVQYFFNVIHVKMC